MDTLDSKREMIDKWLHEEPAQLQPCDSIDSVARSDTFLYRKRNAGKAKLPLHASSKPSRHLEVPRQTPYGHYMQVLKLPESTIDGRSPSPTDEKDGKQSPPSPPAKQKKSLIEKLRDSFRKHKQTPTPDVNFQTQSTLLSVPAESSRNLAKSRDSKAGHAEGRGSGELDSPHTDASDEFTVFVSRQPRGQPGGASKTGQVLPDDQTMSENNEEPSDFKVETDVCLPAYSPTDNPDRPWRTMETQTTLSSSNGSEDNDTVLDLNKRSVAVGPSSSTSNRKTQTAGSKEQSRHKQKGYVVYV